MRPHRGEITEAVYGLGRVKSIHRFEVKLGVMSTVRRVYVREGDFVKKGTRLIDFDSPAVFHAPFDGTVTYIANYDGETSVPNAVIFRMENLRDRFIELSLEQEGALRVKRDQPAKVSFETLRGRVLTGKVRALFSREDEFLAHIDVANLEESVLPGMTADVAVEIGKIPDALLIPLTAIRDGVVLVKRGGRSEKVKVEVGIVDGMWAEVKGDTLKTTDEIYVPRSTAK
ncbi:MAG: secretion protein HlyD [Calothrix sp. SM1_5_4]|nr:secretion protein HlyD [Calothrix sp. SM1_5_4]